MPTSAAIMKRQLCIMTSLLWVLGQCSSDESKLVTCTHLLDKNILRVKCLIDYSGLSKNATCNVDYARLFDKEKEVNVPEIKSLTFNITDPEENYKLTVRTDCGTGSQTINIIRGEHEKIADVKSPPPTDDPPVQTGVAWAIGGVIAVLTLAIVLLAFKGLRRHSSLWTRAPSADMDVEGNEEGSSRQDSHSEPLSGGQELRDTHTPPMTSHTDDSSS